MADSSGWRKALFRFRPQLEEKVNVEHIISSLHEAVPGGFLTSREEQDIRDLAVGYQKVGRLVQILATKNEKAFNTFVAILKKIGQGELADELERAAKEGNIYRHILNPSHFAHTSHSYLIATTYQSACRQA